MALPTVTDYTMEMLSYSSSVMHDECLTEEELSDTLTATLMPTESQI